jgi:SAM-dependent methyltransferase
MSEFNPDWFDEEFYRRTTGDKGAKRDQNSPNYIEYAHKVKIAMRKSGINTLLDIGCGMGWRTLNHIDNGFDATGCDISRWAFENSVLPPTKHICSDMRDLKNLNQTFDVVSVERSIEYLPEGDLMPTLETIYSLAKRYVIFSVIISDHRDQTIASMGAIKRLSMFPREYWNKLFSHFDWRLNASKTRIMLLNNWDGIWVFEKGVMPRPPKRF